MEKERIKPFIARRVAMEFQDGWVVNLGIGLPTLCTKFLPEGVHVIVNSEIGIIGQGPTPGADEMDWLHVVDAGGMPAAIIPGGSFTDSATNFCLIRGGHVDAVVLGGLEVDEHGSLSNWKIPGKMMPGMGGSMDLLMGARHVIVAMEHTSKGSIKILKQCKLPYTAVNCIHKIITEMCVIDVTPQGLVLREFNSELGPVEDAIKQIQAVTEPTLIIPPDLKAMP